MPQPEDDPKSAAKKERYKYSTDQLMNQFLKMESGGLGKSAEYRRGHEWNFVWCSEDPAKAQPERVAEVQRLMAERGWSFERAFDYVRCDCGCACTKCGAEFGGVCDGGEPCRDGERKCTC